MGCNWAASLSTSSNELLHYCSLDYNIICMQIEIMKRSISDITVEINLDQMPACWVNQDDIMDMKKAPCWYLASPLIHFRWTFHYIFTDDKMPPVCKRILNRERGHQMTWRTGYNTLPDLNEVLGCVFMAVSKPWKDRRIFRHWFSSSPLTLRAVFRVSAAAWP